MTHRHCLSLLLVLALACDGKSGDDTAPGGDTDTDADTDVDTDADTDVDDGKERVTILHTNDWQSHMLGWGPNSEYSPGVTGDDGTVGGLARVKTLADEIRGATTHPVVLYDGGDWMGGALFQELRESHAPELQAMQAIGYDAACIGNHEFDWGPQGLGALISRGDAAGVTVPLLAANVHPDAGDPDDDALEAHFDSGRIEPWRIDTLDNGLTIGVVGLMGEEAWSVAPAGAPLSFTEPEEAAAEAVTAFNDAEVDLMVALTHNGVNDSESSSPDHILAAAVPELHVVVGGHSHTPLFEPRIADSGAVILQAGAYTRYLGELVLARDPGGEWGVESYELHEIDDSIQGDPDLISMVEGFSAALDEDVLPGLGYGFAESIASIPADLPTDQCVETGLGDLITDAYRTQINLLGGDPVDVAFETQGVIRDPMLTGVSGIQSFSDAFRVLPLGEGFDGRPGYPLVSFYTTAAELQAACEVTASVSPIYGCSYYVEQSGMRCTYDPVGAMFYKVSLVELWDDDSGSYQALDTSAANTELYRVAVDAYTASLMYTLEDLTFGVLAITPKTAAGVPMDTVYDGLVDTNLGVAGIQELKLWEALVDYAQSLPDTDGDGVADVPTSYATADGRILTE